MRSLSPASLPLLGGFAVAAACFVATVGCGAAASDSAASADGHDHGHDHDHDHGHKPESLHEAVAQLTSIRDAVHAAIVDGDPDDAHGPLHEVGELLEALPDVAAETDLPKEEWDAVKAANERLFDAFGAIDKAFHVKDGDKKAAYEKVSADLDEAIEEIRSRLPLTGEDPAEAHDHDEHDHDEHGHDDHEGHGHDDHEGHGHGEHDHDHDGHDHDGHDHDGHDHDGEAELADGDEASK